jgi:phosphoglycolate phosphatase
MRPVPPPRPVQAVLFDKDGTLFDFAATWESFAASLIMKLGGDDAERTLAAATALRFDMMRGCFMPGSPAIAGTNREIAELLGDALGQDVQAMEALIVAEAARAPLQEAVALVPFLAELAARDLGLGVMTNDSESVARAHLEASGVLGMFDFVAGADSGHGAKPEPTPLLAFAQALRLEPAEVVMVGDSPHDLMAARSAGMRGVGVLTGLAPRDVLAPLAEVVFPDIGFLPAWLDAQRAR